MATAAEWYAKQGLPVFPCKPRAKEPLTAHGFKDATTDPAWIAAWWQKWPDANIAMPTGAASGLLAVDIDPRNRGDQSLDELESKHGRLPDTAEQITGGGGRHIIFRHPGMTVPKVLARGIDLKGDGGYIILAPSIHPSGNPYQWDGIGGREALLRPAGMPSWVLKRLRPVHNGGVPAESCPDHATKWLPGNRNNALTSLAGTMRGRGMSQVAIEAALLAENQQHDPPLPEAEVRRIAESVARYKPGESPVNESLQPDECKSDFVGMNWPDELGLDAFHGLAGEFVHLVGPETEADAAALLFSFLVTTGSIIGRVPYYQVGGDRHYTNLFSVIVGESAKARKGTSWGEVRRFVELVDEDWRKQRIAGGLSSGEGLIHAVRDPITEMAPQREGKRVVGHELQMTDAGVDDKRLMVVEGELSQALQAAGRDGNTLSAIIRQAWDGGPLRVLAKNARATCMEPHISVLAHITVAELKRQLTNTDMANGFANRFLWICAARSKCLPFGGAVDEGALVDLAGRTRQAIELARNVQRVEFAQETRLEWSLVYPTLSEGHPGLLGATTARAEAQTVRLAMLYALLDQSAEIKPAHLRAAREAWRYCEDSARFIFGDSLGDPTADEILNLLHGSREGVTRNELTNHFKRNKSSAEIGRALAVLQSHGLARAERLPTGGRAAEVWKAVTVRNSSLEYEINEKSRA
ncbi:MAG: bifunctional DNA primase/polymerase [Candidatus Korobacteraceae bacterium]